MHLRGEPSIHPVSVSSVYMAARDLRCQAHWSARQAKHTLEYARTTPADDTRSRARWLEWSAYYWGSALVYWRAYRRARDGKDWRGCFARISALEQTCDCAGCCALRKHVKGAECGY